jgi:predicted amidophosphoribosyltransferase
MKVCPDCGYKIDFGSAKFCHNCGNHLTEISTSADNLNHEKSATLTSSNVLLQHIVNEQINNIAEKDEKEEVSSIYDLGVNLEEVIEQIFIRFLKNISICVLTFTSIR